MEQSSRSAAGREQLEETQLASCRSSQGTLLLIMTSVDDQVQRDETEERQTATLPTLPHQEGVHNRELDGQDTPPAVRRTTATDMSLPTLSQNLELAFLYCVH